MQNPESDQTLERHQVAARIVHDAGGLLIGRTRLQKVAYLATLAGYLDAFTFEYRHYGPYSEQLAGSMEIAAGLGLVAETDKRAEWGGWYAEYRITDQTPPGSDDNRKQFIAAASKMGAIALELAATAAFLKDVEGLSASEVWDETARRKPDKATQAHLAAAKEAYRALSALQTNKALPAIPS